MNTKRTTIYLILGAVLVALIGQPLHAMAAKNVNVDLHTTDSQAVGTYQLQVDIPLSGHECFDSTAEATHSGSFSNNAASYTFSNMAISNGAIVCVQGIVQDSHLNARWGPEYTYTTAGSGSNVDFTDAANLPVLVTEHTP